tara:strand:- start:76691 stop:76897 length:207 start_codon:yes stop_codon:yes gene_type:complete
MEKRVSILYIGNGEIGFSENWFVVGDIVTNGIGDEIRLLIEMNSTLFIYENVVGNMSESKEFKVWIKR